MKVGIVGSRGITDYMRVKQAVQESPWYEPVPFRPPEQWGIGFVSGGADGVDSCAERFAEEYGLEIEVIEPDWDDWSRGHPAKVRNTDIVIESDAVVAVWDGQSEGTRDTIDKALDRGVPLYVDVV